MIELRDDDNVKTETHQEEGNKQMVYEGRLCCKVDGIFTSLPWITLAFQHPKQHTDVRTTSFMSLHIVTDKRHFHGMTQ